MSAKNLAFVDIETTGGSFLKDRIIEIGILRVEDGKLVQTYQSLINPETYLSPYITSMTGITDQDLENAPTFSQIKNDVLEIIEDCVFVAHNVAFDYGFLKTELKRLEIPFRLPKLDTVKLSRLLFPRHRHHNLDALIERFNFLCSNRHRAFDDAKVLWDFYQMVQTKFPIEKLVEKETEVSKSISVPLQISQNDLDNLPESPGVYIFFGENGTPLYVGKSINIRDRVLSHFRNTSTDSKDFRIAQQIHSIETIPTFGELGALLKESVLIKKLQPLHNRMLRNRRRLVILKKTTKDGIDSVVTEEKGQIYVDEIENVWGIFKTKSAAKNFLIGTASEHSLCHKVLGLEKGQGACFNFHLEKCKGVCAGKENPLIYNLRFSTAFQKEKIKRWPFEGPIIIKEEDSIDNKGEVFIIDKWCLLGTFKFEKDLNSQLDNSEYNFDLDTYKILVRYLYTTKNRTNISLLNNAPLSLSDSLVTN